MELLGRVGLRRVLGTKRTADVWGGVGGAGVLLFLGGLGSDVSLACLRTAAATLMLHLLHLTGYEGPTRYDDSCGDCIRIRLILEVCLIGG